MLHPGLKITPFKLTGYCRMRSKDGKFKPRRRRMQNVWLYSVLTDDTYRSLSNDNNSSQYLLNDDTYRWRDEHGFQSPPSQLGAVYRSLHRRRHGHSDGADSHQSEEGVGKWDPLHSRAAHLYLSGRGKGTQLPSPHTA